jgi:dolichol-phosphate mannosyltransferase
MDETQIPEKKTRISIITPAFNETDNLPVLYEKLSEILEPEEGDWEWVVVDDHSSDETFKVLKELSEKDPRVRGLRLSRNCGSHIALTCGLHHARGDCAIIMAADMQDPPEVLPELLKNWEKGTQIVWAVRAKREGEKTSTLAFARLFYFIMRHFVGIKDMPASGADFVLIDRLVMDSFVQFRESNVSIMALLTWMGFRQEFITYDKQARMHGSSGWTLAKKIKLVLDSVTSFTYLPIRMMTYTGFIIALAGFLYAIHVIVYSFIGHPPAGWASLMVIVLFLGGLQMLMMGVLGEYVWRALDEARRRPRYLIEDATEGRDEILRDPEDYGHR